MTKPKAVFAFDTIEMAFDYANFDDRSNDAYLDRQTGNALYFSMLGDSDEEPDDFEDSSRYIAIPDTRDFGLGSQLALEFASELAPALLDDVRNAFSGSGAFRRFKVLLERRDLLDCWHKYEADYERSAILQWCDRNEIHCTKPDGD
ncbi:MAG: UPF0158 family protein [Planctomycetota bacterium]